MLYETLRPIRQLWHREPSGIFVPATANFGFSLHSSETYFKIKEKAAAVEALYADSGISLPHNCDLACLIRDTRRLSDAWLLDSYGSLTPTNLFAILHFNRISEAILPLKGTPEAAKFLERLTAGSLNLFHREKSIAKDFLWELELLMLLRASSFDSVLAEPDIAIRFECSTVGIACKKLYSEKHVQNVLSEATAQTKRAFDCGVVALNIDDLWPSNWLLRVPTLRVATEIVTEANNSFLVRHDRHFRKYLSSGRLLCVLVSSAVIADIP